jgi:energy-coupling factor transporter transmembrane protein EcfT
MREKIPSFLLERPSSQSFDRDRGSLNIPFLEKGLHHLAGVIKTGYAQWETASTDQLFQTIDARVKVLFLLFYVVIVSLKKEILPEALIGVFVFILAMISRLNVLGLYKRVLFLGFVFGFLIALPSAFNFITGGKIVLPVLHLSKSYHFWIYRIPEEIGLTAEGVYGVIMLTLRVMNSLALSFLVIYTTPFPEIIRALKVLKAPDSLLMIITLTYKYIFIFAKTAEEMYLAKKSRLARQVTRAHARKWIAGRLAFIFNKTRLRCEEIFRAMLSRGFSDRIKIYGVRKLQARDWAMAVILMGLGVLFLWM